MNWLKPPAWFNLKDYEPPLQRYRRVPQPRKLSRAERRAVARRKRS